MAQRRRNTTGAGNAEGWALLAFMGFVLFALALVWVSVHIGAVVDGSSATGNPFALVAELLTGKQGWTSSMTVTAVMLGVLLLVLVLGGLVKWARSGRETKITDHADKYMGGGGEVARWREAGGRKKAERLAPELVKRDGKKAAPGIPFGQTVRDKKTVYSSWEDVLLLIAGPRTNKSTAFAIPALLAAPGPALATSNKRDVLDATRDLRSERGKVWPFDPQKVANEPATWWWNPLSYIAPVDPATGRPLRDGGTGHVLADEARAEKLAGQFVMSTRAPGARTDAYFDGEAENLIGLLLLAAALGEEPITKVYTWLTSPTNETPVRYLREHGFDLQEQSLFALSHLPDKQREGVYGTARSLMGWLRNRRLTEWVTPTAARTRPQFHPEAYARSCDTLYLMSRDGEGSAGPLVAALTVAVLDSLQEYATKSPGGRIPIPFVGILDEAANITRIRNLDSLYSFLGSQGILLFTILQNWAQGVVVWGKEGMEKLWSAANVKIYGGGVDDPDFLRRVSDLIGPYDEVQITDSRGKGHTTRSKNIQQKSILTVAELREMHERAIAFASGTPAMLLRPVGWFEGEHASAIEASLRERADELETATRQDSRLSAWDTEAL